MTQRSNNAPGPGPPLLDGKPDLFCFRCWPEFRRRKLKSLKVLFGNIKINCCPGLSLLPSFSLLLSANCLNLQTPERVEVCNFPAKLAAH